MTIPRHVLVLNAGSSSLKAELFSLNPLRSVARATLTGLGGARPTLRVGEREPRAVDAADHAAAADSIIDALLVAGRGTSGELVRESVAGIGHRIVHGGAAFTEPAVVTAEALAELRTLSRLAPLHNPPALAVLDATRRRFPEAPAVAVFDTAFFTGLPEHVRTYAIPLAWRDGGAVRRYGFHGIAHSQLLRRYRELRTRSPSPERVITLHLGSGCSAAALLDGRPVETSMGYTPLEGLIMATRAGDLDAGVLLERLRANDSPGVIERALNRESGLLALSEQSADMRELLDLEARGDHRARLAVAAFLHRVVKYVGAYAAVLGGVDAVLLGGGVGEGSAEIRRRICERLSWLGVELDTRANDRLTDDAISARDSAVDVYALAVREELAIAEAVCERLALARSTDRGDIPADMEAR